MCAKGEYTETAGTLNLFSALMNGNLTLLCRFFAGLRGSRVKDEEARVVERFRMYIVKYVLKHIVEKKVEERATLDLLKCLLENVKDWDDSEARTKVWEVVVPLVETAKGEGRVEDLVEFLELASMVIRGVESLVELDDVEHVRKICDEILSGKKGEEEVNGELEGQALSFVTAVLLKEREERKRTEQEDHFIATNCK